MKPTAVIFDLGETLFEPLPSHLTQDNLIEKCKRLGAFQSRIQIVSLYGECRKQTVAQYATKPYYKHASLIADAFEQTCLRLRCDIDPSITQAFVNTQGDLVRQNLKPRSDCIETLNGLHKNGFKLGIASNIDNDWLDPLIDRWQLAQYFEFILSSETAQSCKPDQKIFQISCDLISSQPQDIVFVGDDEVNDIQGASKAGMATVLFNGDERRTPGEASFSVDSLSALLDLAVLQ